LRKDPKVIVIGIDGLEYNFVKEWRLKNIMQKKYCMLDLSDYTIVATPPIWGSMLTGEIDQEIMDKWIKRREILGDEGKVKQKWWAKFGSTILPKSVSLWMWKTIFRNRLGGNLFETTSNYIMEKNVHNLFELFKNPWTNGVPGYNWREDFRKHNVMQQEASDGDNARYIRYIEDSYHNSKKQLLAALESKTFDLVFWYEKILDSICHASHTKPINLMGYYLEMNELIGIVKEKHPNSVIYIVSDHGMERKKGGYWWHSNHAFFSSSNGELIEKPFQLYNLIKKSKTLGKNGDKVSQINK